jgi:hypothetical protein
MSRISALPWRDWREWAAPFVDALTVILKTPEGQQRLRLGQTGALIEAALFGLVQQGRVGSGKTLVLALAPVVLGCSRPLIMTTGGLLDETWAHIQQMRKHWQIPADLQLLSYTALSNYPRQSKSLRDLWPEGPDYIGCDEVQNLANVRKAAVAKQIQAWQAEEPGCRVIGASGSLDLEGLPSYGHVFDWCLREASPLPRTPHEVAAWASVIDEGEGDCFAVCADLGIPRTTDVEVICEAFRERLLSTPGVIVDDTPYKGTPLTVREHLLDVELEAEFEQLRELGQRPDGLDVLPDDRKGVHDGTTGLDPRSEPDRVAGGRIAETARQLGRGFFYKLRFPAPPDWLRKRRTYFAHVRASLEDGLFLTEAQVRNHAIEHGLKAWAEWASIQPEFVPEFQTVWLSTDPLCTWLERWAKDGPGVVWTEHIALGPHLQEKLGWTYFGGKGLAAGTKVKITDGPRPSPRVVLASRRANGTGRNLQFQWNRCCMLQPVGRAYIWEQTIGRLHREGLESWTDRCHVDILMSCSEDWRARQKVLAGAQKTCQTFYSQKACSVPWEKISRPTTGWAFS